MAVTGLDIETELSVDRLAEEMDNWDPARILTWALSQFDNIAISFSGAEDVVLVDMAVKIRQDVSVFSLDTGRLHPETYRFLEKVRVHYGIQLELIAPDTDAVQQLVREKGLFSFYRDGHQECCAIRKVAPLRRKVESLDAWITGQRKDQSLSTRAALPVIQTDNAFSKPGHRLTKFNPLTNWTSSEVWHYIHENDVPFNELHSRGFVSIGCEPCTRPVLPIQHEREGRWWWEQETDKECGLHANNLKAVNK